MTNTIINTNKVSAIKSRSTDKLLIKVSRVAYGEIENNTLIVYRKATQSIVHSIIVFAEKNNLTIKYI